MDDRRCRTTKKEKKMKKRERTSDEEMKEIEKRERERKERGSCKESVYAIAHFVNNSRKHTHTHRYIFNRDPRLSS